MPKKQKITQENLAEVAEEKLGIPQIATEETPNAEMSVEAIVDLQTELAYLYNRVADTEESVKYLLGRYAKAEKAAQEIKKAHMEALRIRGKSEKELFSLEHDLLGGKVIWEGIKIPKLGKEAEAISAIERYRREVARINTRIADIIAENYGFENANEVFALLAPKEKENDK